MYTPKHFINTNTTEVKEFIKQNSFGILISQAEGNLLASHIPFEFSDDETKLTGHVSRANPQWRKFEESPDVLTIFSGPHAYISSSWYSHENVPTWNYLAAHVYGKIKIIDGDLLYQYLKKMVDTHEVNSAKPVAVETMSPEYIQRSMQGIVGFEIEITKIEATYKLSQNRDAQSYDNIVHELEKHTDDDAQQIAGMMKKNRCPVTK